MREVDPSGWPARAMARRWHVVAAGTSRHAGVLGVFVVATAVVASAGALSLKSSPAGLSLPQAAIVAPHPVPTPVRGPGVQANSVTVVAPVHRVDVFDEQTGQRSRTSSSSSFAAHGTSDAWSNASADPSDDQAGPTDPTETIESPPVSTIPGATTKPPVATTTTTTHPVHYDGGTSDDGGWHSGTTTTTTTRSGGSAGSTPSTTRADK
jgi:hypothetical protein